MVTFDATTDGTLAAEWDANARHHDRPRLDLDGVDQIVVVAAHPDDETLGAGGLIAEGVRRGIRVTVLVVTDGNVAGLADVRAREFERAMALLGAEGRSLGFADGRTREQREAIAAVLEPMLDAAGSRALVVAPWRGDGHRDHRVVGEIVAELWAGRRWLEYPVWMWHWARPDSPEVPWSRLVGLEIDGALKQDALAEYSSQTTGESPVLRSAFLDNFARGEEFFIVGEALERDYFEAIHQRRDDPWGFESRWYEERKRDITVASLPAKRYVRGVEIGCSIGVLTLSLTERVDDLLAVDVSALAVDRARARLGSRARVEQCDVLVGFPPGQFDLIVLSEVAYYFGREGLEHVLDRIQAALSPDGVLVACHWRHPVTDYPLSGDEVHRIIGKRPFTMTAEHREEDFVLGVFSRDPRSVAQREGLA